MFDRSISDWSRCASRNLALTAIAATLPMSALFAQAPNAQQDPRAQQDGRSTNAGNLAVRAGRLHTATEGPNAVLENAVVLIEDGKIQAIGPADAIPIPDSYNVLEAAVVTPGLVDGRSCVGLAGWLNTPADKDELDPSTAMQPELRALDAYNAREPLVAWLRGFGVTTVHTGHAPGALISGQTMVVKTRGETVEEALLIPAAMVSACLGDAGRDEGGKGDRPGTPAKGIALLRSELIAAQVYAESRESAEPPDRDLRKEALARVLAGELPLLVSAHRQRDLASALRLAREFDGMRLVLDGASEIVDLKSEVLAAGIPVLLHATMYRSGGETENLSMATAAELHTAGIPFALQSGYEAYVPRTRVVLFEAAIAARYGLPREAALRSITIDAAKLIGVAERVGSLEVGKDGDLALFDGDPFEYTTHCIGTVIDGVLASSGERK